MDKKKEDGSGVEFYISSGGLPGGSNPYGSGHSSSWIWVGFIRPQYMQRRIHSAWTMRQSWASRLVSSYISGVIRTLKWGVATSLLSLAHDGPAARSGRDLSAWWAS